MSLIGVERPVRSGWRLAPGSLRLVAARWLLVVAAGLPAVLSVLGALASSAARQPYFTGVDGRLPLVHLARLGESIGSALATPLVVGVLFALAGQQILTAGALEWLGQDPPPSTGRGTLGAALRDGTRWLWTMLRVVALCAGLAIAAGLLVNGVFQAIEDAGQEARWSGFFLGVALPAMKAVAMLVVMTLIGAFGLWTRVALVHDERRVVRTAALLVLRAWGRAPLRGPALYAAVTLISLLVPAAVLAAWRQLPGGALATGLWSALWLAVMGGQSFLWHWLLRAALLTYAGPRFEDLHGRPDGPLNIGDTLRRFIRLLPGFRRTM